MILEIKINFHFMHQELKQLVLMAKLVDIKIKDQIYPVGCQ